MMLDVSSLFSGLATSIPFSFSMRLSATSESSDSESDYPVLAQVMPLTFSDVVFPEPVQVNGTVVSEGGYVLLTEDAAVTYETGCARCLAPIRGSLALHVEKAVAEDHGETELVDKENDDYIQAKGGFLDLGEPLMEELMQEFPSRVLCREDCAGICPGCGVNLNLAACSCKQALDPRFAVLSSLLETMPDDEEGTEA